MAEINDEVFANFARELVAKLTEVVKNIDTESIDLYKLGYEKGRTDEREKTIDEVLEVVEWDGYTFDIKERIKKLKGNEE